MTNNPFLDLQTQLTEIQRKLESLGASEHQPEYLNIDQASELLNLSKSAIYKRTMAGTLPFYKMGKKLIFKRSELLETIQNHKHKPAPQRGVLIEG
jgi:excisionase family DNA binding protein